MRSWAALGAYVGGLGSGSGPKLAVLGPMLAVLGEKWPKPERGGFRRSQEAEQEAEAPEASYPIFLIDIYIYLCCCLHRCCAHCREV